MATTKKATGDTGPFTELEWSVFSIENRSYRKFNGEMCEAYQIHSRLRNSLMPFTVLAKKGGESVFHIEIDGFPVLVPFSAVCFEKRTLLLATPSDDLLLENSSLVIGYAARSAYKAIKSNSSLTDWSNSLDISINILGVRLNLSKSLFDTMQKLANWAIEGEDKDINDTTENEMKVINTIEVLVNDKILTLPSWARFIRYDVDDKENGIYVMASVDSKEYVDVSDTKIDSIANERNHDYEIYVNQHGKYIAIEEQFEEHWVNKPKTQNGEQENDKS